MLKLSWLEFSVKYSLCFDHMVIGSLVLCWFSGVLRAWSIAKVLSICFFSKETEKILNLSSWPTWTKIMKHHKMHIHVGVVQYDLYSPHYLTGAGNYSVKSEWVCKSLFVFCFLKVVAKLLYRFVNNYNSNQLIDSFGECSK